MKRFKVLVTSDATAHTYVTVDAPNVRAAERAALEKVEAEGAEWTLDDNRMEPYICDLGNCADEVAL